eukprot:COSAG02_NODE_47919_length_337_cov_1.932773_1_plen_65_part_10
MATRPEDWESLGTLRMGHQSLRSTTAATSGTSGTIATHSCVHKTLYLVQGRHGHRRHEYTGIIPS